MKIATKKFRLYGLQPLLGSVALDKEIYTNYLATKGKTEKELSDGIKDVENVINNDEKGITGFYRDIKTGNLILKGYQIKGFFKGSAKALKDQLNIASCVSKIDKFVFIDETNIPIMRNGEWLVNPDGFLERPLHCETAQGPRVSLAKSEMVETEWYVDITVKVVENSGTRKSVAITMDLIEELLQYGQLNGLLQWRNAGYGSFRVEVLD